MIRQNIFLMFAHVYAEKCLVFAFQGVYIVQGARIKWFGEFLARFDHFSF